jgi:hypothetical protein
MATSPQPLIDFDSTWVRGTNSSMYPGALPLGYSWNAINMLNIGGMWSCRPGFGCLTTLPAGKLQGATIFRPRLGLEQMLVAVDGAIYVADFPFLDFRLIPNIQMLPSAKQVWWVQATQVAKRRTEDFASAIDVIPPREVMFIFDGWDNTAPAWYDGSDSDHLRDAEFETPTSGAAAWIGDRLWVSRGKTVLASDVGNPFSFREQTYLGGTVGFNFDRDVTALVSTPSLEFPQLMVFTEASASILQANIRDRSRWPTTDNFQREILQVGTPSSRSVVSHFGRISWVNSSGVILFDSAHAAQQSGRTPIRDTEMMVSKVDLHDDLSLVACGAFGPYLLYSVPSGDIYNKHTWVLNDASVETLNEETPPSWSGYWLGTRPVEWVYGDIAGAERIYHVSADEDGQNRLWEAFRPERLDNGCPITWALETRGFYGESSQQKRIPGGEVKFGFAELAITGIEETLDLGVFFAGGTRGAYRNILAKQISVERGSLRFDEEIQATSELFAFKPQSRKLRTLDAREQSTESESSCPVESNNLDGQDESHQLLIVGHGPATIRWIRTYATEVTETTSGDPDACKDETQFNAVRFDGEGVRADDFSDLVDELASKALSYYTANKTVAVESAVGVGVAESVVSQNAADRVATRIAERMAEVEHLATLPRILSLGEGFEE